MSDRGMKKYAPYASLIEQESILNKMRYEKNKTSKPIITEDRALKINSVLSNYKSGPIKIKYFFDGYLLEINEPIKRIDTKNQKLVFEDGELGFKDIIDIEGDDFF